MKTFSGWILVAGFFFFGCSSTGRTAGAEISPGTPNAPAPPARGSEPPAPGNAPSFATECAEPEVVDVAAGGTIARPVGSALRFVLVYQGGSFGARAIRGVDMVVGRTVGPFTPGETSGYWIEVRTAVGDHLFTKLIDDPTWREAPGEEGDDWAHTPLERCTPKVVDLALPNDTAGTTILVYGSPYGTQGPAAELARFTIE